MLRYGLYARKSNDDRFVTEKSIGEQIAACQDIAAKGDLIVVLELEESKSAKTPGIRPFYTGLIAAVEAGEIDGILCWHVNRLVRNMEEGGKLVQLLVDGRIKEIRTPHAVYHPEDNILPIVIEAASATQYSRDLSTTVKRSLRGNFERGNWNHKALPGYKNTRLEFNLKRGAIEVDEKRFPLMRKAWDLLLTDLYSVSEILDHLNTVLGYVSRASRKKEGRPMSASTLYSAFRNPFYAGLLREEGLTIQGNHRAMVTAEEFARAQEILTKRGFKAPHRLEFPFTGLMTCVFCGNKITAEQKKISTGLLWVNYRCSDVRNQCTTRGIASDTTLRKISSAYGQIRIDPDYARIALSVIESALSVFQVDTATREQLDRDLKNTDERIRNLEEMGLSGLIAPARYRELQDAEFSKKQKLLTERNRLTSQVERMRRNAKRALEFTTLADEKFQKAHNDTKHLFARMLADRYDFDGVKKHIQIHIKPLLREISIFAKEIGSHIELQEICSHKQKGPTFADPFCFGGVDRRIIELPEPLIKELQGEEFPEFNIDTPSLHRRTDKVRLHRHQARTPTVVKGRSTDCRDW